MPVDVIWTDPADTYQSGQYDGQLKASEVRLVSRIGEDPTANDNVTEKVFSMGDEDFTIPDDMIEAGKRFGMLSVNTRPTSEVYGPISSNIITPNPLETVVAHYNFETVTADGTADDSTANNNDATYRTDVSSTSSDIGGQDSPSQSGMSIDGTDGGADAPAAALVPSDKGFEISFYAHIDSVPTEENWFFHISNTSNADGNTGDPEIELRHYEESGTEYLRVGATQDDGNTQFSGGYMDAAVSSLVGTDFYVEFQYILEGGGDATIKVLLDGNEIINQTDTALTWLDTASDFAIGTVAETNNTTRYLRGDMQDLEVKHYNKTGSGSITLNSPSQGDTLDADTTISWEAIDTPGNNATASVTLQYSINGKVSWNDGTTDSNANDNTYGTSWTVDPETTHLRAKRTDMNSNSIYSSAISVSVDKTMSKPSLTLESNNGNADASWSGVDQEADEYLLERADDQAFTTNVTAVFSGSGVSSYTDTSVTVGNTYYYRLTINDTDGPYDSNTSDIKSITVEPATKFLDTVDSATLRAAYSMNREMVGGFGSNYYELVDTEVNTLYDQSGNNYDLTDDAGPPVGTISSEGRSALDLGNATDVYGDFPTGGIGNFEFPMDILWYQHREYNGDYAWTLLVGSWSIQFQHNSGKPSLVLFDDNDTVVSNTGTTSSVSSVGTYRLTLHDQSTLTLTVDGATIFDNASFDMTGVTVGASMSIYVGGANNYQTSGGKVAEYIHYDGELSETDAAFIANNISDYYNATQPFTALTDGTYLTSPARNQQLEIGSDYTCAGFYKGSKSPSTVVFEYYDGSTWSQISTASYNSTSNTWIADSAWSVANDAQKVRMHITFADSSTQTSEASINVVESVDLWAAAWHDPDKYADTSGTDYPFDHLSGSSWLSLNSLSDSTAFDKASILAKQKPGRGVAFVQIGNTESVKPYRDVTDHPDDRVQNSDGTVNTTIDSGFPVYENGITELENNVDTLLQSLVPTLRERRYDAQINHWPLDNEWFNPFSSGVPLSGISQSYVDAIKNDPRLSTIKPELTTTMHNMYPSMTRDWTEDNLTDDTSRDLEAWVGFAASQGWSAIGEGFLRGTRKWFPNATLSEYNAAGIKSPGRDAPSYPSREYNGIILSKSGGAYAPTEYGTNGSISGTHASYHCYRWLGNIVSNQKVPFGPFTAFLLDMIKIRGMVKSGQKISPWVISKEYYQGLCGIPQKHWKTYWDAHVKHTMWEVACEGPVIQHFNSYTGTSNTVQLDADFNDMIQYVNNKLGNGTRELQTDRDDYWWTPNITTGGARRYFQSEVVTCVKTGSSTFEYLVTPHIPETTSADSTIVVKDSQGNQVDTITVPSGTDPGVSYEYTGSTGDLQFEYTPLPASSITPRDLTQWTVEEGSIESTTASDPDGGNNAYRFSKNALISKEITMKQNEFYVASFAAKLLATGDSYYTGNLSTFRQVDGTPTSGKGATLSVNVPKGSWETRYEHSTLVRTYGTQTLQSISSGTNVSTINVDAIDNDDDFLAGDTIEVGNQTATVASSAAAGDTSITIETKSFGSNVPSGATVKMTERPITVEIALNWAYKTVIYDHKVQKGSIKRPLP